MCRVLHWRKRDSLIHSNHLGGSSMIKCCRIYRLNIFRLVITGLVMFIVVVHVQGAICDINKQPRVTTIIYICDENGKNQMEAITEVASCEYEVEYSK